MNYEKIQFNPGSFYSLGVEIEFQIVNRNDFSLIPLGPVLQDQAPVILQSRISPELIKSILEIQTGICKNLRDVENDLLQTCSMADELAADNNCLLYASSLHPFARAGEQELSNDSRYKRIMQELQIVGRRFISQGLHVHVGVPDGESAIKVCNIIQAFLPIFLALSTSSPFFQGRDTGLMSYRSKLFEVLPLAGIYEYFKGWQHFSKEVDCLREHGIIRGVKDLWWDARPSPGFGTVEIRICDLPNRFRDILALVALIQSCVAWLVEEKIETKRLNSNFLKANKWQAVRHGLSGRFIDPTAILGQEVMELGVAATVMVNKVAEWAVDLGAVNYLSEINKIVAAGTGADRQRDIFRKTGDLKKIISYGHQEFWT